jgi:hypothetical protein
MAVLAVYMHIVSLDDPIKCLGNLEKNCFLKLLIRIRKTRASWLSVEIKKLIWERDRLKRRAVYTNDENDNWDNFKTAC